MYHAENQTEAQREDGRKILKWKCVVVGVDKTGMASCCVLGFDFSCDEYSRFDRFISGWARAGL